MEYSFMAITPGSTQTRMVVPIRILSMDQRELFNHLAMRK